MNAEKYAGQVAKYLKCSGSKKREIKKQITSDIKAAEEEGDTLEQVLQGMGEPRTLAAEFNESFSEVEKKAAGRAKLWKILAVVLMVLCLLAALVWWALPKSKFLSDSKVFSEEQVQEQAERMLELFNQGDYKALKDNMIRQLQEVTTEEAIEQGRQYISADWGEMITIGNSYRVEISQFGKKYAVVQMTVSYENTSAVFTMSFDEDLKLSGFFVQ